MKQGCLVMVVSAVVEIFVVGCESGVYTPPPQQAQTAPPRPVAASSLSAPAPVDPHQHAQEILDRAQAIRQKADQAMALDGTTQANEVRQFVMSCRRGKQSCIAAAKEALKVSAVGSMAGLATYLTQGLAGYVFSRSQGSPPPMDVQPILQVETDLPFAEELVKRAMEEAQKVTDARAEQERQMNAEAQAISDATTACAASEAACKTRCDKEPMFCLAWAVRVRNARQPRLVEAKTFFQRACDGGVQHACVSIPGIDQQIQQAVARVESLWSDVTDAGDDLVQKKHQAATVARMANTPRMQIAVQRMQMINAAIVTEKYCPAKKAFIQGASVADFQTRATKHCRDEAPTGQGLSGAEVTLTAECQAVYATSCP